MGDDIFGQPGPSKHQLALRNAMARADAAINELGGVAALQQQGYTQAEARQRLVHEFLPEEQDKVGISRNRTAGFAHGLADVGTDLVQGVGGLVNSDTIRDWGKDLAATTEQAYNEDGRESTGFRTTGNLVGQGALAMGTGNLVARGLMLAPEASAASKFGTWLAEGQGIGAPGAALKEAPGLSKVIGSNLLASAPTEAAMGAYEGEKSGDGALTGMGKRFAGDAAGIAALHGVGKLLGYAGGRLFPHETPGVTPEAAALAAEDAAAAPPPVEAPPAAPTLRVIDPELVPRELRRSTSPTDAVPEVLTPHQMRLQAMERIGYADPVLDALEAGGKATTPGENFRFSPSMEGDFNPRTGTRYTPEEAIKATEERQLQGYLETLGHDQIHPEPAMPSTKPGPVITETGRSPESATGGAPRPIRTKVKPVKSAPIEEAPSAPSEPPKAVREVPSPEAPAPAPNGEPSVNATTEVKPTRVIKPKLKATTIPEEPVNGEPSVNSATTVKTPKVKKGAAPKVNEGIPGERTFNPDEDIPLMNETDEAGNKVYVLRRASDGTLKIAPAKGGEPVEAPPFEKLEARRPGTPGRQASRLKSGDESPLSPSPSEEVRGAKIDRATQAAIDAEAKTRQLAEEPEQALDLRKTPDVMMGHPSKSGTPSGKPVGLMDANSESLRIDAERARANPSTTPRVAPYKSKLENIEAVHQRGLQGKSPSQRLSELGQRLWNSTRETFVTTPRIKGSEIVGRSGETKTQHFLLQQDMRRELPGQARAALNKAVADLVNATAPLRDANEADIMARKLLVEHDLEDIARGHAVPLGLDEKSLLAERASLDEILKQQPQIAKAVQNMKSIANSTARDLEALGFLPDDQTSREWYFHNEVLDFLRNKVSGSPRTAGASTKLPNSLKRKLGSLRDYDRDYIGVMAHYYTGIREALARYDIVRKMAFEADFRYNPLADVEHLLADWDGKSPPPGYVFYNVKNGFNTLRGTNLFERLSGDAVSEDIAQLAKGLGVSEVELSNALPRLDVPGHPLTKDIAVIPKDLADELLLVTVKRPRFGLLDEGTTALGQTFKYAALNLNPIRRISRDLLGDTERAVAQFGTRDLMDKELWKQTFKDVYDLYTKNVLSPRMELWQRYMVTNSGRIVSEIGDVRSLSQLRQMKKIQMSEFDKALAGAESLGDMLKVIGNFAPKAASFREDLLRVYIANMNYSKVLRGLKPNTGIVDPKEFALLMSKSNEMSRILGATGEDGLARASALVARKSLIDYGDFTPAENVLRNSLIPFYAWAKGNTNFWGRQLPKAIMRDGAGGEGLAVALGSKAIRGAATIAAMMTTIRLWNSMVMHEAEDRIPTYARNQNHIILPDPDALMRGEFKPWYGEPDAYGRRKVHTLAPTDAADDFFRMVGLDGAAPEFISYLRGDIDGSDLGRYIKENALYATDTRTKLPFLDAMPLPQVARNVLGSVGPFPVGLTVAATGTSLFPDPLNAQKIPEEQIPAGILNSLAMGGTPFNEMLMSGSEQSLAPVQNTVTDPLKSLGIKELPMTPEGMGGSRISNMRRDISQDIADLDSFEKRILSYQAGFSQPGVDNDRRQREYEHMMQIRNARKEKIQRKLEIYWKLQRYQETAGR